MFKAKAFLDEALVNNTEALKAAETATPEAPVAPPKFTEAELKAVEDMLKEYETWIDTRMTKQSAIEDKLYMDPEIYVKDLNDKGKLLQATVLRLINRKDPKAPRPVRPSASSSSSTTATTTDEATSAGTETASTPPPETTGPVVDEHQHDEL